MIKNLRNFNKIEIFILVNLKAKYNFLIKLLLSKLVHRTLLINYLQN
jgi:hypothetical protein